MKRVAVLGMGYVGCVTAACLSRDGHHVVGVDIDPHKVDAVNHGRSPVAEPGLEELIAEQTSAGRLRATTDLDEAVRQTEIALIAVGTPSATDGSVETRAVERVVEQIATVLQDSGQEYNLVIRSTILPGVLEDRLLPILQATVGDALGSTIHVFNNPEFLRETTAIRDYDSPPFVVVGTLDEAPADEVLALYDEISAERITTDTRTSAMVKYACNAFHAVKVGFANEIGTLAKSLGADGQDVMRIVCRDTQLNISPAYMRPGFAFGGSCLPKDVRALTRYAQQQAVQTDLLRAILSSNEEHIARALRMVMDGSSRKIGLVGLSFKAGTDDLRESPQVVLAEALLGRGYDLKIFDPGVGVTRLVGDNLAYVDLHLPHLAKLLVEDAADLFEHADMLVLGTDIANQIDWEGSFHGDVIDLRRDLVVAGQCPASV